MSRTSALELNIFRNGSKIKSFSEQVSSDGKDVSTLLAICQKTKESSNDFLTTLVNTDKSNAPEGIVISHSKRKHAEEGTNETKRLATHSDIDDCDE